MCKPTATTYTDAQMRRVALDIAAFDGVSARTQADTASQITATVWLTGVRLTTNREKLTIDIHVYQKGRAVLAIRLPQDIENRLTALASKTGRTKTFYVREAILEHLEDLEDLYLAEQRYHENQAGRSRTFSLDDVEKNLDVAD